MDKLEALRAFVQVADSGGFSSAARALGVATSSVTRLVDSLEASLGAALVTRTTRSVALTDSGATYLQHAQRILSDLEEADQSIADGGDEPVGRLRVSCPVTFAKVVLGPHIQAFMAKYPKVSLDLVLSDSYVDLVTERIDLAVRIGTPTVDDSLVVRQISEHHRFVVASHDYLQAAGQPKAPVDLAKHEVTRFAYSSAPQRWTFTGTKGQVEVEVNGRLTVNNSDMVREAVLAGQGIGLLPEWLVGEDVRTGRLARLFSRWKVNPQREEVSLFAAYLPNRRQSRKVHAFLDFLQDCVAPLAA